MNDINPASLSLSFHNAIHTHKCPDVIKIMANQLTLLFRAGRIFAARKRCHTATVQCATTTSRASVRGFVKVDSLPEGVFPTIRFELLPKSQLSLSGDYTF
jgi:hypothetical protein